MKQRKQQHKKSPLSSLGPLGGLALYQAELVERIIWLINLRWLAFVGVITTIIAARFFFPVDLPWNRLLLIAAAIPIYNFLCYLAWRKVDRSETAHPENASTRLAHIQISCDLLVLGALIHLSGGVENPFAFYFVFHIVIASILLSPKAVFAQSTIAVAIFAAVALGEYFGWLPHYSSPVGVGAASLHTNGVFVFTELWALATALYVTGYFATTIASNLRLQEDEVVRLSRQATRDAEELRVAYDKLAKIEQAKSLYARKVAHELRSPLAAIESLLRVVVDGMQGDVAEQAREMVERARLRAHGLLALVKDLLMLAAAREAKELSQPTNVDLGVLANDVVELARPHASDKSIEIDLQADGNLPEVFADHEQMAELLTNLVSNAIKYSPESSRVTVRSFVRDGSVAIEVADTGIGIDPADHEKIFEEFYRTSDGKKFTTEGTGLGLSIVKSIVESHGGAITVDSELGKGTTFKVSLPVGKVASG